MRLERNKTAKSEETHHIMHYAQYYALYKGFDGFEIDLPNRKVKKNYAISFNQNEISNSYFDMLSDVIFFITWRF